MAGNEIIRQADQVVSEESNVPLMPPSRICCRPVGVMNQICQETKSKIQKVEEHLNGQLIDLKPLKNEYIRRYNRLSLNTRGIFSEGERSNLVYGVTLQTVHERATGDYAHVVLMVGAPGEGKTASAIKYTNRALDGSILGQTDVKIVIFIKGKQIKGRGKCTPYELLFSKQFGNILTNKKVNDDLEQWVAANPSQVLVVIDGIEEVDNFLDKSNEIIGLNDEATPLIILLNILRSDIYSGMWVLCTTTPNWIWKLDRSEIPEQCVEILGLKQDEVVDILSNLTGKRERITEMMRLFPNIRDMCKTPSMLIQLARKIQRCADLSEAQILLEIMNFLDSQHTPAHNVINEDMQKIMKLAHNAAKERRTKLHVEETSTFEKTSASALPHFILAMPHAQYFNLDGRFTRSHHLVYEFRSEAIRDTLAALHLISCGGNVKTMFKDASSRHNLHFVSLALAFIADDGLSDIVISFSKTNHGKLSNMRKEILTCLENSISATIRDPNMIRLLSKCRVLLKGLQSRNTTAIKLRHSCEAYDVFAVADALPTITTLKANCMIINSSSFELLQGKFAMMITHLQIKGEMHDNESRQVSQLLSRCNWSERPYLYKFLVDFVEFSDCGMYYDVQAKILKMAELQYSLMSVVLGLFHFIPGDVTVQIKKIDMNGLSKNEIRLFLEKLTNIPGDCYLNAELLICPELASVPPEIVTMMTVTPRLHIKAVAYGDVTCIPKIHRREIYNSYLNIDGVLTMSSTLLSLIKTEKWNEIRTTDLRIYLQFRKQETVEDGTKVVAAYVDGMHVAGPATICYEYFIRLMIKLESRSLAFSDIITITSEYEQYNGNTIVNYINLSKKRTGVVSDNCYWAAAKILFENVEAARFEFETLVFTRNLKIDQMVGNENLSHQLEVVYLDTTGLAILEQLLTTINMPPLTVNECCISTNDIPYLKRLSSNISQIDTLNLNARQEDCFSELVQIIELFQCKNIHMSSEDLSFEVIPDQREAIKIDGGISLEGFITLYDDAAPVLTQGSHIFISQLFVPSGQLQNCRNVFKNFTDVERNEKGVCLQIRTVICNDNDALGESLLLRLTNESRWLMVCELRVGDVAEIMFEHDDNNTIKLIHIDHLHVGSLLEIYQQISDTERKDWRLMLKKCSISDTLHDDFLLSITKELETFFLREDMICNVEHMHVNRFHPEVLGSLNEALRSGRILHLEYQDKFGFSVTRHKSVHNTLLGVIDKVSSGDLVEFTCNMGEYLPEEIIVQLCEVGRAEDISERFKNWPKDDFYDRMLKLAVKELQKKTMQELDMLRELLNQNQSLRIQTLAVNGENEGIDWIANVIDFNSSKEIEESEQSDLQVDTLRVQTLLLGNQQQGIGKILKSGRCLEANCLRIETQKGSFEEWNNTMKLITNENLKVSCISSSSKLKDLLPTFKDLLIKLNAEKLSFKDGVFELINDPLAEQKKLLVALEGDIRSTSVKKLSKIYDAQVTTEELAKKYKNPTEKEPKGYDDLSGPHESEGPRRALPPLPQSPDNPLRRSASNPYETVLSTQPQRAVRTRSGSGLIGMIQYEAEETVPKLPVRTAASRCFIENKDDKEDPYSYDN